MIQAIALDDEPPALRILERFCAQTDFLRLQKTFTAPDEALRYLRKFPVDLLFLDIHMPGVSGLDFYRAVPRDLPVIFTTAHSRYAVEGFNLKATDYLLKPFTPERFRQAAETALEKYESRHRPAKEEPCLYIRADYSLIKIRLDDIVLVEGLDDYLKIYLHDAKPVVARMTLKAMAEKLPGADFVRIHRSFIVPLCRIESVRNKTVRVADRDLPLGASFEENFLRRFGG